MKAKCRLSLLSLLVLAPILGCGRPAPSERLTVVEDDAGRTVRVPETPQRLVSLAPNITELIFAAGAGERLVGVTTADDFPPEVADLPQISALPLSVESLAALEPDLVFAVADVNSSRVLDLLDQVGIPTYVLRFDTLEDIWSALVRIGELAGTSEHARRTQDSLLVRVEHVRESTKDVENRPTVLVLLDTETLYAFGGRSYVTGMIEIAGGRSLTADIEAPSAVLTEEFVVGAAPEVIVGAFTSANTMERLLTHHPAWRVLPAIKNGRICTVDPDLVLRPGPRIVAGIESIAQCLANTQGGNPDSQR